MLSIGQRARSTGVKVPTIRYYEQTGLIEPPERSEGNQRRYGAGALNRLRFIRHARDLGFSIETIRELIDLSASPDRPCADLERIARGHLDDVEARIARLRALRSELRRMINQCAGGTVADCRVIEAVADHTLCNSEH